MATAVRMQVLNEILRVLRDDLAPFDPDPDDIKTVKSITKTHIQIRKVTMPERDIDQGKITEQLPGMFVCMPFTEPFNPNAATNEHDEYQWSFLIQIVDSDNWQKESGIATYLQWQEQICKKFQFFDLTRSGNVDATLSLSRAMSTDVVDEKYWIKLKAFKAGIVVVAQTWLTRG